MGDPRERSRTRTVDEEADLSVMPRLPCIAVCLACAVLAGAPAAGVAGEPDWPAPAGRPRIGLVLSGGGARGAAHIGVLQVLEAHRIPVDVVAGTSMGSLVGGLYASGLSPAELDSVIVSTQWNDAFADNIPRAARSFHRKRDDDLCLVKHKPGLRGGSLKFPPGILDGYRVDLLLKRLTLPVATVRDFDRLRIPFRAVAADIATGERVVLGEGDLALALRSSMAIPAAFAPREIGGHLLVDGGIVDNLPIEVARTMGADVVIAVDIGTPPPKREELASVTAITMQLGTLAAARNRDRQVAGLTARDVFIQPDLGTITTASFARTAEAVRIGARAAEAALGSLERYALSPGDYRAYCAARDARAAGVRAPVIAAVRVENHSRLSDAVLATRLHLDAGRAIEPGALERHLDQVYGLELFESVYYDVLPGATGDTLVIRARARSWGPAYLQAGVSLLEDVEHPNFNLALAVERTALNPLNGEWRLGVQIGQEPGVWTELHQPLDRGLRTFVDVLPQAGERNLNMFGRDGRKVAELVIPRYGATFAAGRELGTWAELRCGVLREGGRVRAAVGTPAVPVGRFDTGEAFVQFFADELDEVAFPHRGGSTRVRFAAGRPALGSRARYEQWDAEACVAATRGGVTANVGGLLGTTRGDAPLERQFCLGGLGQLSGLVQDERIGPHAALVRTMIYRRLGELPVLPAYAGLTGEFGEVFASRAEIGPARAIGAVGAFMGLDTPIGPLCLGYGLAEGGRANFCFTLGQPLGGHRAGFRVD